LRKYTHFIVNTGKTGQDKNKNIHPDISVSGNNVSPC
jgi:hypothetical protein